VAEVAGPWQVTFDPNWGGPDKPVTFTTLEDWSKSEEKGIKYYSGSATYKKSFECPSLAKNRRVYLDLGVVKDLAEVSLNGKKLGTVWCAPWRIEITDAVRAGSNDLELVVVNQWVNRLIGDSEVPQKERVTWTTHNPYNSQSTLRPSGLLGPVRVVAE
jgi:hypothetical protein